MSTKPEPITSLSVEDIQAALNPHADEWRLTLINSYLEVHHGMSNTKKAKKPLLRLREVAEVYQMLENVKFNGYICGKCDKGYLSVDLDEGGTPAFTQCYATEGCDGIAASMGYPEGEPPKTLGQPTIEWYKPDPRDYNTLSAEEIIHAERGGLIRRAGKYAPDWVKAKLAKNA